MRVLVVKTIVVRKSSGQWWSCWFDPSPRYIRELLNWATLIFFFSGILTLKFLLNIHSLPAFPFGHKNNFLSSRSLSLTPTRLNYFLTRVGRSLIHSKRRLLFRFAQSRISVVLHSYFYCKWYCCLSLRSDNFFILFFSMYYFLKGKII